MPRKSPYIISLAKEEHAELTRRAKMILFAAQGLSNDEIANRLDTPRKVVSIWRKRFFKERLLGLDERPRPGRPPTFPPGAHRSD